MGEIMREACVSVVIVSYHTGPVLWHTMESVILQEALQELIIVDNGNPEGPKERLEEMARYNPKIHLIRGQQNVGFAAGCNLGVNAAQGKYVLLLNPDCILSENALSSMCDILEKYPEVAVVGPRIINPDGTEQRGSRRMLLTPFTALVELLKLHKLFPRSRYFSSFHQHNIPLSSESPVVVPAISGACMFMKRRTYERFGGFDERYFLHVEDLDFCYTLHQHYEKILFVPQILVMHHLSTSNVPNAVVEKHKAKSFIRYFYKHFKGRTNFLLLWALTLGVYMRYYLKILLDSKPAESSPEEVYQRIAITKLFATSHKLYTELEFTAFQEKAALAGPVLVAGASGLLGISIIRRMLPFGIPVVGFYHSHVLNHFAPSLYWLYADFQKGILPDRDLLCAIIGGVPQTLVYTGPLWLLPQVLPLFHACGIKRLVAFSSTSVLTKSNSKNSHEREMVRKLAQAEEEVIDLCNKMSINWTIFRTTLIYGYGLDKNITNIARFIKKYGMFFLGGEGKGLRQPVHADDLALAVLNAIPNQISYGKIFHLSGGEKLDYHTMVERIFIKLGKKPRIVKLRILGLLLDIYSTLFHKKHLNGEMVRRMEQDLVFNHEDAKQAFGYTPRSFLYSEKHHDILEDVS